MELWAKINGEKVKFQGSFKRVMEELLEKAGDGEAQLLSLHTGQKERRRFKRDFRAAGKNLKELARNYIVWSYRVDLRKLRRTIRELNKKRKIDKEKAEFYKAKIEDLKKKAEDLEQKINALC